MIGDLKKKVRKKLKKKNYLDVYKIIPFAHKCFMAPLLGCTIEICLHSILLLAAGMHFKSAHNPQQSHVYSFTLFMRSISHTEHRHT